MSELFIPAAIVGGLMVINGMFVAAEFCIIGVRPTRIAQQANEGNRTAQHIRQILEDPALLDRYLVATQLGITVASLSLGMYTEYLVMTWLRGPLAPWAALNPGVAYLVASLVAIVLLALAHVVIGEMVPRSLALQYAERTAFWIDGLMQETQKLFFPLVVLLMVIGNGLLRWLQIPHGRLHRRLYSPEELELMVTESHKGGLLSDDERQIIQNIFDLDERRVGQVMTPRPRISAIPLDIGEEDLRATIAASPYSRFPVYEGGLDHIVGLLLTKDFVRQQLEQPGHFDLRSLLRRIPAVPEAMTADRLLVAFKRSHVHMALVFDEYGGTAGVVTLEDLVEEVVGEVHDEFDQIEQPLLCELENGVLLARGDLMLDDLAEKAPGSLPDDDDEDLPDVDTVGGLVVSLLGRPAQPGDQVALHGTVFVVERVSGFAVDLVRITLQSPVQEPTGPEEAATGEAGEPQP
ncbi:MAG: HlyC/CorC family transporter [Chloroflexaceae bacterium]|nr:HlyC/CorC family transporter [Chloroflexaceae bacterium]